MIPLNKYGSPPDLPIRSGRQENFCVRPYGAPSLLADQETFGHNPIRYFDIPQGGGDLTIENASGLSPYYTSIELPLFTPGGLPFSTPTTKWQPNTPYSQWDRVVPTSGENDYSLSDYWFICVSGGVSNTSEPSWIYSPGNPTLDNTVKWCCVKKVNPSLVDVDHTVLGTGYILIPEYKEDISQTRFSFERDGDSIGVEIHVDLRIGPSSYPGDLDYPLHINQDTILHSYNESRSNLEPYYGFGQSTFMNDYLNLGRHWMHLVAGYPTPVLPVPIEDRTVWTVSHKIPSRIYILSIGSPSAIDTIIRV